MSDQFVQPVEATADSDAGEFPASGQVPILGVPWAVAAWVLAAMLYLMLIRKSFRKR